jgi:hypothetical protein
MASVSRSLAALTLWMLLSINTSDASKVRLVKEDEKFWNRFLRGDDSLSIVPTPPPQPKPTPAPVAPPQPKPTPAPVAPPQPKPTPAPQLPPVAPVAPPQPNPTPAPQQPPVPPPQPQPVFPPTGEPTPFTCPIEVLLDCTTEEGLPCRDFPPPDRVCETDIGFLELTFRFNDDDCSASDNQQGNSSFCADFQDLTEPATLECISNVGTPLIATPPTIGFGDTFTVTNPNGGILPRQVDCTIINANRVKLQQNVIDTSGNVPLTPGDRFGSFELETCVDDNCFQTLQYDIDIRNNGGFPIDITKVDFTFNDDTESLLGDLEVNPLNPGRSTSLLETREVNVCTEDRFNARVETEGEAPDFVCIASAEFNFAL